MCVSETVGDVIQVYIYIYIYIYKCFSPYLANLQSAVVCTTH